MHRLCSHLLAKCHSARARLRGLRWSYGTGRVLKAFSPPFWNSIQSPLRRRRTQSLCKPLLSSQSAYMPALQEGKQRPQCFQWEREAKVKKQKHVGFPSPCLFFSLFLSRILISATAHVRSSNVFESKAYTKYLFREIQTKWISQRLFWMKPNNSEAFWCAACCTSGHKLNGFFYLFIFLLRKDE